MGLHLLPLGVADATSALHYSSSFALECDGHWLLVECPHPIRLMMSAASKAARVGLDVERLEGVLITSAGQAKASGLTALGQHSLHTLGRTATLLAHPDVLATLPATPCERPSSSTTQSSLHHLFDVRSLATTRTVSFGPFEVECRRTLATTPTTAVRVRADNRTFAYSSDTPVDEALLEWLGDADVFLHDGATPAHVDAIQRLEPSLRTRAQLIHYPDAHDAERSVVPCARAGRWYRV